MQVSRRARLLLNSLKPKLTGTMNLVKRGRSVFTNRSVAAFIVTAVIVSLLYTPALASGTEGQESKDGPAFGYGYGYRPGWGYGDNNHTHIGPPGQVDKDEKSGWGHGDDNHNHSGPPGQVDKDEKPGKGHGDDNHDHSGPPGKIK